ncbi:MAG: metallophosphoesterase [Acidobacteriota bacterium]|nr:MAG: metallophosphoesterase [Acidobacteriota bacterium]
MNWRRALLILPAFGLCLVGWTFYYEPSSLEVRRYELTLAGWPHDLDGIEIALLSDLHVGSPYYGLDKLEEVVRRVNASEPDLVLLAGDYVIDGVSGGRFVPPEEIAFVLAELDAPLGVFAVLGNHDWWLDGSRVRRAFENAGIRVLDDQAVRLPEFWIVGLGDWWEASPDIPKALASIDSESEDAAPVVAFTHNPDAFPKIPPRVTLTLAGHTHGGQVRFPFLGTPIVPSRYGARYARGLIVENGRHLFVTSGLGTSIIPARFRVPPEIALLRLSSARVVKPN